MISLNSVSDLPSADLSIWLNGPALNPPVGEKPNFDHPANKNHLAQVVLITGLVLSTSVVLIRVYSRLFFLKRVEIEDC